MNLPAILRQEASLLVAALFVVLGYVFEHSVLEAGKAASLIGAAVFIAVIVLASTRVAHHAEVLAHKVGDPYGTMILTLSAVAVEVLILAIMMGSSSSPTLVRDTIYSAVMLDINGILGLAALLGGLRHGEQPYNDDSSRTYSVMILTAMGISMIVPEFVPDDRWRYYSMFTIVAMIALYGVFLKMQVGPHSYFFSYTYPRTPKTVTASKGETPTAGQSASASAAPAPAPAQAPAQAQAMSASANAATSPAATSTAGTAPTGQSAQAAAPAPDAAAGTAVGAESENEPAGLSIAIILVGVLIIGFLAEFMSAFLDTGLEGSGAPPALTAVVVAAISAAPEILTALRAALRNRMQSVVNIAMGASLSTVILTVPVMEGIALYTGQPFIMAMTPVQT